MHSELMLVREFRQEVWWRLKEECEEVASQPFCQWFFKEIVLARLPSKTLQLLEPASFYFTLHEEIPDYHFPMLVLIYLKSPLLMHNQPQLEVFCSTLLETAYLRHLVISGHDGRNRRLISFSTSDRRWTSQSLTEV